MTSMVVGPLDLRLRKADSIILMLNKPKIFSLPDNYGIDKKIDTAVSVLIILLGKTRLFPHPTAPWG